MLPDPFSRNRWAAPLAAVMLFLGVFTTVFCLALPREAILGWISPRLEKQGIRLDAQDAFLLFPAGVGIENGSITVSGSSIPVPVDRASVCLDLPGAFRGLPLRFQWTRGKARIDLRLSGASPTPGRGRLSASNLSTGDLAGIYPGNGLVLAFERCEASWTRSADGSSAGKGQARLSAITLPIPAPDSPVKEALIRDVDAAFSIRGGSLQVSSLRGKYEGSPVEGTGEITDIGAPSRSAITFNLKIPNPYEGNVASIFNLVAKNAKNASLRIYGPLLAPAGEFHFF